MKRILIIGDNCIDRYWVGHISGQSAEADVPVVKQHKQLAMPGMAGNVQRLLQELGGVETQLIHSPNRPIKNRLMTGAGQQLARWDSDDFCEPITTEQLAIDYLPDAIIVCDYAKGAVSPAVVRRALTFAEAAVPVFVDTKGDPMVWVSRGSITLFPNQVEYMRWQKQYDWLPRVVHKMGAQGMRLLHYGQEQFRHKAYAQVVQNVCGAGDAVIAGYATAIACGAAPEYALAAASDVAAQFVENPFDSRSLLPVNREAALVADSYKAPHYNS